MEGTTRGMLADRLYLAGFAGVVVMLAVAGMFDAMTGTPVPLAFVLATGFLVIAMVRVHGTWSTMGFLALVIAIPFGSEFLGVLTGVPYGPYAYRSAPAPWVLGLVPAFILIAWIHIAYLSIATTTLAWGRSTLWLAPLDGALATAWDLFVDPLAVRAEYWVWLSPGPVYGIPLSNFLGWFLVVTGLSLVVRWAWTRDARAPARTSRTVVASLPILFFASSLQFAALAALRGFPLAAVVGLAILLPAIVGAWRRVRSMPRVPRVPSHWVPRPAVAVEEKAS